ncbi:endonuclease [Ktedonobacteria bacterium brp13]|nr:endonuclease [Ktedonobacteria bacterium brp13]
MLYDGMLGVYAMSKPHDQKLIPLAKELRKNMTRQEKRLWYDFLCHYRPRFQRQKVIDPFIVDFYCADVRLCIELDGDQHYTEEGLLYDAKRTRILNGHSLLVVRFPNSDVNNNFAAVCMSIDNEVKKRQRSFAEEKRKRGEDGIDAGM